MTIIYYSIYSVKNVLVIFEFFYMIL